MSHTRHHRGGKKTASNGRSSTTWRKMGNKAFRARWRQAMRRGRYDDMGHPRKDSRGWYW